MTQSARLAFALLLLPFTATLEANETVDRAFEQLGERYIDESPALSPVKATVLGDHRFDGQLDTISEAARSQELAWIHNFLEQLERINVGELSRQNQVDYALLRHSLVSQRWYLTELRDWEWNPLVYTGLAGEAVYGLMARDFAPATQRLGHVASRLQQMPRFLKQVRETLVPAKVPAVHAETAVAQNRGVLNIINNMVRPLAKELPPREQQRLAASIAVAEQAIAEHQHWMETELLPQAKGEFRIGIELFEQKLAFTLHSTLRRQEIHDLASRRVRELHARMYEIAQDLYLEQYPLTQFPEAPDDAYRRAIIRFGLEKAYADAPQADEIVETARESITAATDFIRERDLITILPDELEVIVMPEFQRGVSLAYCDSPGPLETGQKTFYAVSPVPADWTETQVRSHLREYNTRSIDVLTIHEAMPGHFLQLAHAKRYPGKLRRMFQSGVFVEGWAVYTESVMYEEGFRDDDPLLELITLKWCLRDAVNALLDQAVHVDGISRHDALRLMVEEAFQEEREAAGKWTRAQLTSAQLSTYFVGYLEQVALRRDAQQQWGENFDLKQYHDKVLSYGSPPPQFVRALVLDEEIPTSNVSASR